MITRTSLANEIDEYDQQIADMNTGKKDCFDAYRAQLVASGMDKANIKTEIEAVKAAIKRRRAAKKDPMAVEAKDALIDEIFEEITTSPRAPRATRENIEKFDPETGEILERSKPSKVVVPIVRYADTGSKEPIRVFARMVTHDAAEEQVPEREQSRGNGSRDHQHVHSRQTDGGEHGRQDGQAAAPDHAGEVAGTSTDLPTNQPETAIAPKVLDGGSPVAGESRHHCDVSEDEAGQNLTGNPILDIASASQGEVEAPSAERVTPHGSGSAVANVGGEDVDGSVSRAGQSHTSNTDGALVNQAPSINHRFRPNCQHRDHCKSGTADHCHSCKLSMREGSAA